MCMHDFYANRCETNDRPALVEFCQQKEVCMNTKPVQSAITLRALTKQIATLINTFTESLTLKSLVFVCLCLIIIMMTYSRSRPAEIEAPVTYPKKSFAVPVKPKAKAQKALIASKDD